MSTAKHTPANLRIDSDSRLVAVYQCKLYGLSTLCKLCLYHHELMFTVQRLFLSFPTLVSILLPNTDNCCCYAANYLLLHNMKILNFRRTKVLPIQTSSLVEMSTSFVEEAQLGLILCLLTSRLPEQNFNVPLHPLFIQFRQQSRRDASSQAYLVILKFDSFA